MKYLKYTVILFSFDLLVTISVKFNLLRLLPRRKAFRCALRELVYYQRGPILWSAVQHCVLSIEFRWVWNGPLLLYTLSQFWSVRTTPLSSSPPSELNYITGLWYPVLRICNCFAQTLYMLKVLASPAVAAPSLVLKPIQLGIGYIHLLPSQKLISTNEKCRTMDVPVYVFCSTTL